MVARWVAAAAAVSFLAVWLVCVCGETPGDCFDAFHQHQSSLGHSDASMFASDSAPEKLSQSTLTMRACPASCRTARAPRAPDAGEVHLFTRDGQIPIVFDQLFVDETFRGFGSHYRFSAEQIHMHGQSGRAQEPELVKALEIALRSREDGGAGATISEAAVGTVGCQRPVAEGLLLSLHAKHVYVLEYNKLTLDDARVTTIQGDRFPDHLDLKLVVALDSVQHSGLGRYGDLVCGDADLLVMDHLLRTTQFVILGIPTGTNDQVVWNGHRVYGPIRLPLLLKGWNIIARVPSPSPILDRTVFLLERSNMKNEIA